MQVFKCHLKASGTGLTARSVLTRPAFATLIAFLKDSWLWLKMEDKLRVEESAGDHEACVPAAASPAMLAGE